MRKVGITGGIGSGKTSACQVFELLGIPVYYADIRAKQLMNTDPELKNALEENFGKDIYENRQLNRRKLSGLIFNDKALLEKVNGLVHPAVARDFSQWCRQQTTPYVLEEAAILFENNMASKFWKMILVTAPEALRIERVCKRDAADPQTVRARINNQWPDEKKIKLADYVIYNDNEHMMVSQVKSIHHKLIEEAQQRDTVEFHWSLE